MSHWLIENRVKQQIYVLLALFGQQVAKYSRCGLGFENRSKNGSSLISKVDIVRASPPMFRALENLDDVHEQNPVLGPCKIPQFSEPWTTPGAV